MEKVFCCNFTGASEVSDDVVYLSRVAAFEFGVKVPIKVFDVAFPYTLKIPFDVERDRRQLISTFRIEE